MTARRMRNTGNRIVADRYVLREMLGAGGMGIVYRAVDLEHGQDVALKILHRRHQDNAVATERFAAEAHAGMRVRHPNVVAVRRSGASADGSPFLVMELVRGELLDKLAEHAGELPLRRVAAIVGQLLSGLQALHAAGFVHGDVKTGNVLVGSAGTKDAVKLIDLGLARAPDRAGAAKVRMASGTPEYMAPEVIRGEPAQPASDVYAAGVVLYELLTGTTPFEGGTARDVLRRHLDDHVVPPALRSPDRGIPRALERAVMIALAKHPEARYPSAAAFAEALAAATPRVEPPCHAGVPRVGFSATAPTNEWTSHELAPTRSSGCSARTRATRRRGDTDQLAELTVRRTHPQLPCMKPDRGPHLAGRPPRS